MKVLLFLCFFLPETTSFIRDSAFNGINYHYINESAPTKPDNNMTYCEYMYDDKDEWKPILIITDEKTVPRKIGFNCGDNRKECCSLGCCTTFLNRYLELLEFFGCVLLLSLGFILVMGLICWLIDFIPKCWAVIKRIYAKITPPMRNADRDVTKQRKKSLQLKLNV